MKNLKYFLLVVIALSFTTGCVEDDNVYVEPSPWKEVVTTTLNYAFGPLKSITFPTNPIPGEDVIVALEYVSPNEIKEARIYYSIGENPEYVKDNRIKGEDDPSFTQTSVVLNMKEQTKPGDKTTFYIRISTEKAEYYYGDDPNEMALDNTISGGSTDESDRFKGDPSEWNVFYTQ